MPECAREVVKGAKWIRLGARIEFAILMFAGSAGILRIFEIDRGLAAEALWRQQMP
jgi:hypothetical protein